VREILIPGFGVPVDITLRVLMRLNAACVLGYLIAVIYRKTRPASAVLASSVGADHPWVALAGMAVIGVAAYLMRIREPSNKGPDMPCLVELRVALAVNPATVLAPSLATHLRNVRLRAVSTARQGLSLDVSYLGTLPANEDGSELVKSLNRLEGIQDVVLRPAEAREH
jgi:hypothetical protein